MKMEEYMLAALRQPSAEWAVKQHRESGLLDECMSVSALSLITIESEIFQQVTEFAEQKASILAGSSVHFDRGFIRSYMPTLNGSLSHRHYDVSVFSMLCKDIKLRLPVWGGEDEVAGKKSKHRALADIEYSIQVAREFRAHVTRGEA